MPAATKTHMTGKTLLERMWELLDEVMDLLMTLNPDDADHLKGRAYGIAQCLALMTDPIHATVDDVRATAMERWEARSDGRTLAHPADGRHNETGAELIAAVERKRRRGQTRVHPYQDPEIPRCVRS